MNLHYYIWYRVEYDDRDTESALRGMMTRLGCRTGVVGRLLKKRDEPRLWMEIYADVPDPEAFERALHQTVDEYDVEMFIDGARRSECFIGCEAIPASCATADG